VESSLSVARYVDDRVYRGEMNAKGMNCGGRFGCVDNAKELIE
jgi:hypothetical protein